MSLNRRLLQERVQSAADAADPTGADPHPKRLIQQPLDLAVSEVIGAAQRSHQGRETRAIAAALHIGGQHGAGGGVAAGADQLVQAVFHHDRRHRWDVGDLVTPWLCTLVGP